MEDDPDDAFFMKRAFSKIDGVVLHIVENLPSAQAYLGGAGSFSDRAVHPLPMAIISDLKINGHCGLNFLHWIKQQEELKDIPLAVVTGSECENEIEAAQDLCVLGVHRKPANFQDLGNLIKSIVSNCCCK